MAKNTAKSSPAEATGVQRVTELMKRGRELVDDLSDHEWTNTLVPYLEVVSADATLPHPRVVFRYTVQPSHCNRLGSLHGGCIATLFDYCTSTAIALVSAPGHWHYLGVSRTLNVTYLRPAPSGAAVLIEAEVVHAGKRLCSLRGAIRRADDGALVATCEHGKFNTDPPVGSKI
ncbi:HotDog domain-containing protein [Lasiosphaeria ovina]|uniref:HotDog domain-containing protein n=1 Tax=Lasiosphaeria ovina TaxID=92902 RepID=A0AAE0K3G2_9PEZI|nr:HotDog domain-containing protein [Lasiosphaeria ovina]